MAHKYFNRKPDDWNITDFLNECEVESFRDKVGCYLTSLEKIIKTEKDERCERAKLLYDRYKKDAQPDYHLSRKWKNKREQASDTGVPSVHFNNPIFTGNPLVGNSGNINGGTFVNESKRNMLEREHEKVKTSRKTTLLERSIGDELSISAEDNRKRPSDEDVEQEEYDVKSTKKKSTRKRKSICYTESLEGDHTSDPDYMEKPKRKQESRSKRLREKASCDDTDKGGIIVETSKDTNTSSPARSTVTPNTPRQSLTSLDTSEDFVTSRESTPCPTVHSATSTLIVTPNEYSDATKETITKQIEKDLFDESHVKIEDFESVTVGQKRPYEEGVPSTPSQKIRSVTFNDEESTVPPTPLIDTQNDDVFNKVSHEVYIKIRQDVRDRPSQKDWFIGECNVSNAFRNFQITNIDKLESGDTFFFSLNVEEILSLHHIMLVDLTRMKKPSYVITDERNWRASVRQPSQPDPAEFFGNIMNEYEKVINDIDELRLKFYEMWGKYCDKVIYSDEERRLFETTQIVTRVFYERMHMYPDSGEDENEDTVMHEYIHDTFKETFRDSNYDTVWANSESLSSKDYRSTYGRSQGKKTDLTIYRIIEKGKRKESCFVEVKPFKITRTSKVGGYNLYKVAIFCQGGINNILLCENESGVQTFGGHICEGYIYYCMMDLEYDGIYRFFQLSEIKLARKLSEFNLVRKLILETYLFKRRIDSYYSNRNNYSSSLCSSRFIRNPTVTPKAPKNAIPDVSLKKQKPTKKRRSV